MFKTISFLLITAVIALGINWVVENDGSVEFVWLGYQVNTSMAFFIFALVFTIIAIILVLEILVTLFTIPSKIRKLHQKSQLEQNLKYLQLGYAALLSGDYVEAKKASNKLLANNIKNDNIKNLSEMMAAKLAQESGNISLAQDYFHKFSASKKHKFFAIKGMLDSTFNQGKINEAIEYAEQAYELKPGIKNGARSLLEMYKKADMLDKAEQFLKNYKRKNYLFKDKSNNINVNNELSDIWYNKAKELFEGGKSSVNEFIQAKKYLEKSLDIDPLNKQKLILMMKICRALKDEKTAKKIIEKVWGKVESYELGAAYLDVLNSSTYKDSSKKKMKAINNLQEISLNPEIIEKLKDKIYDIQIEH